MPHKQMTCPAPRRMSVEHTGETWSGVAWTADAVKEYRSIGGWFHKGWHDFADRAASIAAGIAPEVEAKPTQPKPVLDEDVALERLTKAASKLTPAERAILLAKLT